jgi:hypothetical protein
MKITAENLYKEDLSDIEGTEYYDRMDHAADVLNEVLRQISEAELDIQKLDTGDINDIDGLRDFYISSYQKCEDAFTALQLTQVLQKEFETNIEFSPTRNPGLPQLEKFEIFTESIGDLVEAKNFDPNSLPKIAGDSLNL